MLDSILHKVGNLVYSTPFLNLVSAPFMGDGDPDTIMALDISPSMESPIGETTRRLASQDAAMEFVHNRRSGRIGVIQFGGTAEIACPLVPWSEHAQLETAVRSTRTIGLTNHSSPLALAEAIFDSSPGGSPELVFLTDGHHCSGAAPEPFAARLKRRGCIIRVVGIGESHEAVCEALLKRLASLDETGRPFYEFIADRNGLVRHFGELGGLTR